MNLILAGTIFSENGGDANFAKSANNSVINVCGIMELIIIPLNSIM